MMGGSGRPIYDENPAARTAGHRYEIEQIKRRLVPAPGVNPRTVYGQIDGGNVDDGYGAGILDPGSGDWTVSTDGAGNWTITFDTDFGAPPAVTLTSNPTTAVPPAFIEETSVTASGFTVSTYDKTGTLSNDIGFNFEAIGIDVGTEVTS